MWAIAVIILIIIVLVYLYRDSIFEYCGCGSEELAPEPTEMVKKVLKREGTSENLDWMEVCKGTELDPSTQDNHSDFIKETSRYSSGANFTSTTDDNISSQMVNFVGLRRPSSVPISPGRRQIEDLQYDVFDRNKEGEIRWGQGVYIRNESGEWNQ
jgi:hypothetical protein